MQSPQSPYSQPPIPSPDGNLPPVTSSGVVRGDWKTAPDIVRRGTYLLTWLALIFLPLVVIGVLMMPSNGESAGARIPLALFYIALWGLNLWLNRAFKAGTPAAWTVQIVLSVLGLLAFPLGTIIHGYVLAYWFRPETKAWFGKS